MHWIEVRSLIRAPAIEDEYKKKGIDISFAESNWVDYGDKVVRFLKHVVLEVYKPEKDLLEDVYNELLEALPRLDDVLYKLMQTYRDITRSLRTDLVLYYTVDGAIETSYGGFLEWFHGQELVNNLLREHGLEFIRDYDGVTRIKVTVNRPYTSENLAKGLHLIETMLKLYETIRIIQEAEAAKTTLSFLNTITSINDY
ncbi:hypothetical protein J4526_06885 [Desulfurococcaceae archaeon MEX13E-LK6-19]|nr:hypothetical protein J4526_06885 [Desulfurococcaceae archaeon MEX13E-LK6-19]